MGKAPHIHRVKTHTKPTIQFPLPQPAPQTKPEQEPAFKASAEASVGAGAVEPSTLFKVLDFVLGARGRAEKACSNALTDGKKDYVPECSMKPVP